MGQRGRCHRRRRRRGWGREGGGGGAWLGTDDHVLLLGGGRRQADVGRAGGREREAGRGPRRTDGWRLDEDLRLQLKQTETG